MSTHKGTLHFWLILTLALLTMVGPFTIDTYLPSFPSLEDYFHVNRMMMSQSIAIYLIASAFATLFWGALSDSFGRRVAIYSSLLIYLIASLGCAFIVEFDHFLFFRMLQGFAASGGMIVGRAIVRDTYSSKQAHRVMAYIMIVFALAPAVAPIIGGLLHDMFGWQSIFYFLVGYGLVITIMTTVFLPETLKPQDKTSFHPVAVAKIYFITAMDLRFQTIIFTLSLSFGGLFLYVTASPSIIFDLLKLDTDGFAYLFIPLTAGIILGSFLSSRLSYRYSATQIVNIALLVMLVASTINIIQMLFLPSNVYTVIAPLALYAIGSALQLPALSILALDCFPRNRGTASAVQGFVQTMLAAIVTSIVVPLVGSELFNIVFAQVTFLLLALVLWVTVCILKK